MTMLAVFLSLILIVAGWSIFRYYFYAAVDFKYYEPSYFLPNVSIKEKRIDIGPGRVAAEQNFRTVDWVYSITEYKANELIGSAGQNYDPKSVRPTCSIQDSLENIQYRLCHWIDYGRIDVHEIKFIKDGTFINIQIPTTINQQINIAEIDRFVDSFKQRSTFGLPVLHSGEG